MTPLDERLAGLALGWLLTRPGRHGSRHELSKALAPIVAHRWSPSEWKSRCEALLDELERDGRVHPRGRRGLELTPQGHTSVVGMLGVEHLPRAMSWKKLKQTLLLARALDLPATQQTLARLADADGVRAALLRRDHALSTSGAATLPHTRDRLLWTLMGLETEQPFTLRAVQAHLLGKLLEAKVSSPEVALRQLAARAAKASRMDAEALRMAVIRQWLMPSGTEPAQEPTPAAQEPLATFAQHVLTAARASQTGRFGENKVFISHVWRALRQGWSSKDAFIERLLEAHRAHLVSLSRADLVEAMNPVDVSESEVRSYGASFHFIHG